MHTKGKWLVSSSELICDENARIIADCSPVCIPILEIPMVEVVDNARLIAAAPDLLVVSHNLAETMGIDYAIKKLSALSDDTMALGAATILKGIQCQAKTAIKKAKGTHGC